MHSETLEVIPVTEKAYQCSCQWKQLINLVVINLVVKTEKNSNRKTYQFSCQWEMVTHSCVAETPLYSSVKRCCASLILKRIQNAIL